MSRIGGLASFVVASTLGLLAFAEDKPNARLSWVRMPGAESCVDGDGLRKSVSARLGRDPFVSPIALDIDGTIAREPKRWVAKLWMRDDKGAPAGSRELTSEADSCASLGDAVALAIALAIDPDAATVPTAAAASVSVSVSASAPPPPRPPVPRASATGSPSPIAPPPALPPPPTPPAVFVRALLSTSLLPKPAPGVGVAFEPVFAHAWRATFGAFYLPPQRTADRIAGVSLTALSGGLCGGTTGGLTVGVDLCLSLHGGATHATVYRLEPDQPGDRFWIGATAGLRFRVALGGLIVEALADAMVPITRHRFRITGMAEDDALFAQSPGVVAGLGLGWNRF